MTAIEIAKVLAKFFEGLSLVPYFCPAGYRTAGWGHLYPEGGPITLEQAGEFLKSDLQKALNGTVRQCPVLLAYPEILGAITDFAFNLGVGRLQTSTLRRKINQQDWDGAANELRKWVYGGGRKLKGLVLRREAEARYLAK
jgi:lysozyme